MTSTALPRAALSIAEVCAHTGLGRDIVYKAIRSGRLVARKLGRRTLITERDLRRFLDRLPKAGKDPNDPSIFTPKRKHKKDQLE
jgi:excisionase family DNA binding protein